MAIRFLFDFVSPYAFLAWQRLRSGPAGDVDPEPVLFAGLLGAHGQLGPAEIEVKRRYVFRDVLRKAATMGITVRPPHSHPFNPLLALRVVCAAESPEERRHLTTKIFDAVWVDELAVTTNADLLPILGASAERLLATATLPLNKDKLRNQTDRAIKEGVFGVPTLVVEEQLFWGTDSIDFALQASKGHLDPLPFDLVERWDNLLSTANRSR